MNGSRFACCVALCCPTLLWSLFSLNKPSVTQPTQDVPLRPGAPIQATHASDVLYTTGFDGTVLFAWDLRDRAKPRVRVFRCNPSFVDAGSFHQEIELPERRATPPK